MDRVTAPFIWSNEQPLDSDGYFAAIRGVSPRSDGQNRWFLFRHEFDLPGPVGEAEILVTTDGKHQLFANGIRVGRGPARCSPHRQLAERRRLAGHLRQGRNAISLLVHTYGLDTSAYEMVRGHWLPTFGDGAVWVQGAAICDGVAHSISTHDGWRCIESRAWDSKTPLVNRGLGFIESLDGNLLPLGWTEPGFDDCGWSEVRTLIAGGGGPEARFGGVVTRPFPVLVENPLPAQREGEALPQRLVWQKAVSPRADLPIERRPFEEPLHDLADGETLDFAALADGREGGVLVRTADGRDLCGLFDFGRILTGRPRIELIARGGEVVEIAVSESLPGEFDAGGAAPDARIEPRPVLGLDAHVSRYVARPGRQVFETFEWDAVRWMQVTIRDAPGGLEIARLGVTTTGYPAERAGEFHSSDPFLDRLWDIGRETLAVCMHDGWIDGPAREQRQWLGDATVEHLAAQAGFGPSVIPLNAKFLRDAANSQRPDGLTQPFAPGDHRRFGWLIPDFTLQWILNAADHLNYSGDFQTIDEIFPSVLKALSWFEDLQGEDGRIADLPFWHFQDWAAVGRDGLATVLNAQLAGAYEAAAQLADALGWTRKAQQLCARSAQLRSALDSHWDPDRKVYVDCIDPVTGLQGDRVSQHSNAAMILWGGAPSDRIADIVAYITDPDRVRVTNAPPFVVDAEPLALRTEVVAANTFYSHFVFKALAMAGRFDLALRAMRERYGPMIALGSTTLWEGFLPTGSLAHGFSCTPTYQLSAHLLGISPDAPGFASCTFSPWLGELEFARGTHATVAGDIAVSLKRTSSGFSAEVTLPPAVDANVCSPPGWEADGASVLCGGRTHRLEFRRPDARRL
jgi:hypothetical protein